MLLNITKTMREKAKIERENKRAIIAESLYNEGIIATRSQRQLHADEKIRHAFALYVGKCLQAEKEKKSTGTTGKFLDVANRVLKALNRGMGINIEEFACRSAILPDIVAIADESEKIAGKTSVHVELKSGAGELARGKDIGACYDLIADACETGKFIVWYFDVDSFDIFNEESLDNVDYLPHIFLSWGELLERLASYKGGIDTWLREPNPTSVNFQTLSEKKKAFLRELAKDSYDWPTCRDYGLLRKQGEK